MLTRRGFFGLIAALLAAPVVTTLGRIDPPVRTTWYTYTPPQNEQIIFFGDDGMYSLGRDGAVKISDI